MLKTKKLLTNLSLLVVTTIALVVLIEFIFYCINHLSLNQTETTGKYLIDDPVIGYKPKPNSTEQIVKRYKNGKMIYNVTYTIDKYARRITKQKNHVNSHLIFFGGSFTFGDGLNDAETLPYYLSTLTTDYSIYNYAASGYGPNMMLAQLSKEDFINEMKEKEGIAIYIFVDDHIRRAIGNIYIDDRAPHFCLDKNNNLVRKGSFLTSKPFRRVIYNLLRLSQTFRYFKIQLPFTVTNDDIYFTSKLIKQSAEVYESKFDGEFYLLAYPRMNIYSQKIIELFNATNIRILDYNNLLMGYDKKKFYIKGDGHPNFLLNKMVAEKIKKDLGL